MSVVALHPKAAHCAAVHCTGAWKQLLSQQYQCKQQHLLPAAHVECSAGIVGPAAAHAIVAGQACGFLLLVSLRVLTKAVLPDTEYGLRLSFCIYFGVTGA
jgi:hypothetical protein